jgi:hypothetical protein
MLKAIAKFYRPGTSCEDFEKLCTEAFGDDDQDAVLHEGDVADEDDGDDCDETGSTVSDAESLLGSLIGSKENSEVDATEVDGERAVGQEADDDKSESTTLVKSGAHQHLIESSEAESSFSEHLEKLDDDFNQMNLNPLKKSQFYKQLAMSELHISDETHDVVKKALSKHTNPVACDICGELMKNAQGVRLHKAKKHK